MNQKDKYYNDIREIVLEIIGDHLGLPAPTLSYKDNILQDLGADSLDKMELIMTIEELFSIKILDRELQNIETIGDVVGTIHNSSMTNAQIDLAKHTWRIVYKK
jgi:acyl carrier protein